MQVNFQFPRYQAAPLKRNMANNQEVSFGRMPKIYSLRCFEKGWQQAGGRVELARFMHACNVSNKENMNFSPIVLREQGKQYHFLFRNFNPEISLIVNRKDRTLYDIVTKMPLNTINVKDVDEVSRYINNERINIANTALDDKIKTSFRELEIYQKLKKDIAPWVKINNSFDASFNQRVMSAFLIFQRLGCIKRSDKSSLHFTKEGLLKIDSLKLPSNNFGFNDLGINEKRLMQTVGEIEGDADLSYINVSELKAGVKGMLTHKKIPPNYEDFILQTINKGPRFIEQGVLFI